MAIYCLEEFWDNYKKLLKKNSYSTLENILIENLFNKTTTELATGVRLNNSNDTPYLKKRLNGSGGFRLYCLLIIKDGNLYLMHVHPKTGSYGYDNISNDDKALYYKKILQCIQTDELYELILKKNKIHFIRKNTGLN